MSVSEESNIRSFGAGPNPSAYFTIDLNDQGITRLNDSARGPRPLGVYNSHGLGLSRVGGDESNESRIMAAAGAAAILSGLVITGCGTATFSSPAGSTQRQQSTPEAAAPSEIPSTASDTGAVGDTFTYTAGDGTSYDIRLIKVLDPAQGANEFYTPDSGKRFVGTEFKITAVSGSVDENANNNAVIQGSDSQMYSPDFSEISAGTNFNNGSIRLAEGGSVKGWVTFQVPEGVKVTSVQWTPMSGFSDAMVTWFVR